MSKLKHKSISRISKGIAHYGLLLLGLGGAPGVCAYLLTTKGIPEMYQKIAAAENLTDQIIAGGEVFAMGSLDALVISFTLGVAYFGAPLLYKPTVPKK